jgi:hypothetical protein
MGTQRIGVTVRGRALALAAVLVALPGATEAQLARLTGLVFDSTQARPLSDAEVFLIGTDHSAVTNTDGRFFIPNLPPGGYAVGFRHPRLERLGYLAEAKLFTVGPGATLDITLSIPRDLPNSALSRPPSPTAGMAVEADRAVLIGEVRDAASGRLISGASLRIEGSAIRNVSDARGRFVLFGVPAGSRSLVVEMLGYAPRTEPVLAVPGRTMELQVTLAAQAIALAPIEVRVRVGALERVGFYERRDDPGTFGRFFDRAEIERRGLAKFADLFHDVSRAIVDYGGPGSTLVRFRGTGEGLRGPCVPPLYLDGMRMVGTTWDFISPAWIEAVEVYIGRDAPMAYLNACGAVLVWTRRGG